MHPDWVRKVRDQCVAAGVPFSSSNGEWTPDTPCGGSQKTSRLNYTKMRTNGSICETWEPDRRENWNEHEVGDVRCEGWREKRRARSRWSHVGRGAAMNLPRLRELHAAWCNGSIRTDELTELRDMLPEVLMSRLQMARLRCRLIHVEWTDWPGRL